MQRIALVALGLTLGLSGNALGSHPTPLTATVTGHGERVKIYGCIVEDDCSAHYRMDNLDRPVWIIHQDHNH